MNTTGSHIRGCLLGSPRKGLIVFFGILSVFLSLFCSPASARENSVLVLHSYHYGQSWDASIDKGIVDALSASPLEVDVSFEYMDTKRNISAMYNERFLDLFVEKYADKHYDVLITTDNNAFEFAKKHRDSLFGGMPIVFCGVNNYSQHMISGIDHITGVAEEVDIKSTLQFILDLQPNAHVLYVFGTDTPTGRLNESNLKDAMKGYAGLLRLEFFENSNFREIRNVVKDLPPDSAVLLISSMRDENGERASFEKYASFTAAASSVPVYGLWDFMLNNGILGGKIVSGRAQGEAAGQIALRILKGENANNIPVQTESPNRLVVDKQQAVRWNIDLRNAPAGTTIINRPKTIYSEYKELVIASIVLLSVLVTSILIMGINIIRRRQAESSLQESTKRFYSLFHYSNDAIFLCDPSGLILDANKKAMEQFDSDENRINFLPFIELVSQEQRRAFIEQLDALEDDEVKSIQTTLMSNDGTFFPAEITAGYVSLPTSRVIQIMVRDITARMNAEAALTEQLRFTRNLINAVPNPIYYKDLNFRYIGCNKAFAALAGLGESDIIGKTDHDLFSRYQADLFINLDKRMLITWKRKSGEMRFVKKNGERYVFNAVVAPFTSAKGSIIGILGSLTDITEQIQINDRLQQNEARHRSIFLSAGFGISLLGLDGSVLNANPAFERMVGVEEGDLVGKSVGELFLPEDCVECKPKFARLASGLMDSFSSEIRMTRKDGRRFWALVIFTLVRSRFNKPQYVNIMVENIHARKQTEVALNTMNRELEQLVEARTMDLSTKAAELEKANAKLRQIDYIKSAFLSSASHELRTPLTSLLGFTKLIRKEFRKHFTPLAEKSGLEKRAVRIEQNLDIISSQGDRLTRMINDLLDLNRIEEGKMVWRDEPIDMEELLRQICASVQGLFEEKPEVTFCSCVKGVLPALHADPDRITQAVINVISNAVKFTGQGSVQVVADACVYEHKEPGLLHVPTDPETTIRIMVLDSGAGIPREETQLVFDKFHQALKPEMQTHPGAGAGLGLNIARDIVEHYGGLIWAESSLNRGSVFTIELPSNTSEKAQ